jgi:hypothetical protein
LIASLLKLHDIEPSGTGIETHVLGAETYTPLALGFNEDVEIIVARACQTPDMFAADNNVTKPKMAYLLIAL